MQCWDQYLWVSGMWMVCSCALICFHPKNFPLDLGPCRHRHWRDAQFGCGRTIVTPGGGEYYRTKWTLHKSQKASWRSEIWVESEKVPQYVYIVQMSPWTSSTPAPWSLLGNSVYPVGPFHSPQSILDKHSPNQDQWVWQMCFMVLGTETLVLWMWMGQIGDVEVTPRFQVGRQSQEMEGLGP